MLLALVVVATATLAVLAHRGLLPVLDAKPIRVATREPVDGALAVARERLERGEIDVDEYERICAILRD